MSVQSPCSPCITCFTNVFSLKIQSALHLAVKEF